MPFLVTVALWVALPAGSARGDTRTFYPDQLPVNGLLELLDQLVRDRSPWVTELQPYWPALKGEIKAEPGQGVLRGSGSAAALGALGKVLNALDVPRRAIDLAYQYLRVKEAGLLLGPPSAPPAPEPWRAGGGSPPLSPRVAVGDWSPKVADLARKGSLSIAQQGESPGMDGILATVYIGDPEALSPEFCLQARPVLMADGSVWVTVIFGRVTHGRDEAPRTEGAGGDDRPVCPCGQSVGDVALVPELTLSALVPAGQSLLLCGLQWRVGGGTLAAPEGDFLLLVPKPHPGEPEISQP